MRPGEQFLREILPRARHFAYLVSHIPFGGLIALYASAFEWLPRGAHPHPALLLLAAAVLFDSTLLEIGRKIRAPLADSRFAADTRASQSPRSLSPR